MRINQKVNKKTVNRAGGDAFTIPLKERFVSRLLTSFYKEPNYYDDDTTNELIEETRLLLNKDPKFVANAAIYAREIGHLRTTPVVLIGEILLHENAYLSCDVRSVIKRVCTRPDQLKELVAYINQNNNKSAKRIHVLRKAIAECLESFNEYDLAKYNRSGGVSLKDLVLISHVKPANEERSNLYNRLLNDKLETPVTWEVEISKHGNKAEVWDRLIEENSMGYMALLRNLRNIHNSGAKSINKALKIISDRERVLKSKQLPFRFLSAYKELSDSNNQIISAISKALNYACENIPAIEGKTFTSADNSGSMASFVSQKSTVRLSDIANLMQAMLCLRSNAISSVFAEEFKIVNYIEGAPCLEIAEKFSKTNVGAETYGHKVFEYLVNKKIVVDRIIIFTDMQLYNAATSFNDYQNPCNITRTICDQYIREINPKVWVHFVNLAGYGYSPLLVQGRVTMISGFSENILKLIVALEQGESSMIKAIENIS